MSSGPGGSAPESGSRSSARSRSSSSPAAAAAELERRRAHDVPRRPLPQRAQPEPGQAAAGRDGPRPGARGRPGHAHRRPAPRQRALRAQDHATRPRSATSTASPGRRRASSGSRRSTPAARAAAGSTTAPSSASGRRSRPPKCTCEPGGSITITFTATVPAKVQAAGIQTGVVGGTLRLGRMTPVPYLIPSYRGAKGNIDLPLCARGRRARPPIPVSTPGDPRRLAAVAAAAIVAGLAVAGCGGSASRSTAAGSRATTARRPRRRCRAREHGRVDDRREGDATRRASRRRGASCTSRAATRSRLTS